MFYVVLIFLNLWQESWYIKANALSEVSEISWVFLEGKIGFLSIYWSVSKILLTQHVIKSDNAKFLH